MGKEMLKMEMGFDGEQQWVYTVSDGSKDSLEITKTKAAKNEYGMKSDYDKEYSKAKMKEVGRYYEISFSGPKKSITIQRLERVRNADTNSPKPRGNEYFKSAPGTVFPGRNGISGNCLRTKTKWTKNPTA